MLRIARAVAVLAGWFVTAPALAAEPVVVDLWPGKVPGDIGINRPETSRIHPSPLVGPTKLITGVSKPTLTIYRPDPPRNTGTAMIICPGGGYWDLYWELEGEEVAAWLNSQGVTGIILKYRCPRRPGEVEREPPLGPQLDAQRAVRLVRSRAAEWRINPERIGIVGFSAGGHLALATATGFGRKLYEPIDAVNALEQPAQLRRRLLSGLSEGQGQGRDPTRPQDPAGYAADLPGAYVRRQRVLRWLDPRQQRADVPGPGAPPASRPSCTSSRRATTTSACGRTRSSPRAGRGSASTGCATSIC